MSSYLSSLLSSAFGTGAAVYSDSEDEYEGATTTTTLQDKTNKKTAGGGGAAGSPTSSSKTKKKNDLDTEADNQASVPWLAVEAEEEAVKITCNEQATKEVLQRIGETTPLNLISIFGAARQGKSFLMNMLAGEDRLFKISNESKPCTQGVDLSRKVVSWGKFHHLDAVAMKKHEKRDLKHASSEPAPKIAFVDVEGQGDRDVVYDAQLVCPVVLTSKAVIFNWKDSLQKDRVLNLLGVMQRAAFNVATEDEEGMEPQKIFGHLHIVFRDWTYTTEGNEESVSKTLFTPERSNAPDALARNQIRTVLEQSFETITVWLLPPPVEKTTDLSKELCTSDLSEGFKAKVEKLRHALAQQVKTPHHFNHKVLTGPKIASLVPHIVQTLNSGSQILPRSAYASLISSEVTRVQAKYIHKLQKVLTHTKTQAEETPMTTTHIHTHLLEEVHKLQRDFDHWLRTLGDEKAAEEALGVFMEHCNKGTEEVMMFNKSHLLVKHLHSAGKQAKSLFDTRFTHTIEKSLPLAPEVLVCEYQAALRGAEAVVSECVVGEPDVAALPLTDVLAAVKTHAELVLVTVEKANKMHLAGVVKRERRVFEDAKMAFEMAFQSQFQTAPRGVSGCVSEREVKACFDLCWGSSVAMLKEDLGMLKVVSGERVEELEGFLRGVCEGVRDGMVKEEEIGGLRREVGRMVAEKEAVEKAVKNAAADALDKLAAVKKDLKTEIARLEERLQEKEQQQRQALASKDTEIARLKKELQGVVAEREQARAAATAATAAAGAASVDKTAATAWEKEKAALVAERDALLWRQQGWEKEKKGLEEEVVEVNRKRKAAQEELNVVSKKLVRAEEEQQQQQQMAVEEEEEEETTASVKEEAPAPTPAPAAKKATKARGGKGRASTTTATSISPQSKKALVEQAREEERKRIEESTAKRVTRTRK